MPLEGIPTDTANAQGGDGANTSASNTANTSDATAQNTGANANTGAATDTAQQTQAQTEPDKKFTQADVDRIVTQRLSKAVKAELKKLAGEGEGGPNVEDLQRQLSDYQGKIRGFEARNTVQEYLNDGRNKLNIKPENVRGIEELVIPRLEYDDAGKPNNLKEAIETAKSIAPALFVNTAATINAGNGRNSSAMPTDMNAFIRQQAGVG
jgi:hypothetical protein